MTVKRNLITLLVVSIFALMLPGAALADAGSGQSSISAGPEAPLQMTVNLINSDPYADWDTVPLDIPLNQLGITAQNYDDFLDEYLDLVDPDGNSAWHTMFLSQSWGQDGGWSAQLQWQVGDLMYEADLDDWLWGEGGGYMLGVEVAEYFPILAAMSYTTAGELSIERILTLSN